MRVRKEPDGKILPSGSFTLSSSVSVDYMIICVRCYSVDQNIEYYEYQHADCRYGEQKREIAKSRFFIIGKANPRCIMATAKGRKNTVSI